MDLRENAGHGHLKRLDCRGTRVCNLNTPGRFTEDEVVEEIFSNKKLKTKNSLCFLLC